MAKVIDDGTLLLRDAIRVVFAQASEPMTSTEVGDAPDVKELGLPLARVAIELSNMYTGKYKTFPIARIPAPSGSRCQWAYFNPEVVRLEYTPHVPKVRAAPVNDVKSAPAQEFLFDPVQMVMDMAAPSVDEPETPAVTVPAGVKTITLTVAGVSIKIEIG